MKVRRKGDIVVHLDPEDIFTRIFMSTTDAEEFGLSSILQDGYTLASLDSRKYTPAVESPLDRRANVQNVCQTFGVSKQVTQNLRNVGFQSTALLALINETHQHELLSVMFGHALEARDAEKHRLARCVRAIDKYPTEPIHSFLRIAEFRQAEKMQDGTRISGARSPVETLNLEARMDRGRTATGYELYMQAAAEPNCRRTLTCRSTFFVDSSPFKPVVVSTIQDITSADGPRGKLTANVPMTFVPMMSQQAPPTPTPTPSPPPPPPPPQLTLTIPQQDGQQVANNHLVQQPLNVLFVPIPMESPQSILPQPFVISSATPPTKTEIDFVDTRSPPPALPHSMPLSMEKGGCMKGYLGVDAAKGYLEVDSASCRSGSSSSVNSLKSAFDPHAFDKAPPGGRPYHSSPRSSKKGYHHQERTYQDRTYQERTYQGPSDQRTFSTYNFCPFMDCKHYNVALQAEDKEKGRVVRGPSFHEHLKVAHGGFDTGAKAQKFIFNSSGHQDEKYKAYMAKRRYIRGYDRSEWMEQHNRLGQVEEAVDYRLFSPDYFWWGPKVFIRDGIEFFVSVFRLEDKETDPNQNQNQIYKVGPRMVFILHANTSERMADKYSFNVELPDLPNTTWRPSFYRGRVLPLCMELKTGYRSRPDLNQGHCMKSMVWFYKQDLAKYVSPTTGKIHFTLGLYKLNN